MTTLTIAAGGDARPAGASAWLTPALLLAVLVAANAYSHTLFHTLAEFFAATVAILVAVVGRQAYPFSRNHFLMYLACGYFWIAALDLLHALSYQGMGVLPGDFFPASIQLWIGARLFEALLLLSAPLALTRRFDPDWVFRACGAVAALLVAGIYYEVMPAAFVPGVGLTAFKVASEYLVVVLLGFALLHLWRRRALLDAGLVRLMALSMAFTAAAELTFTLYAAAGEWPTVVGHGLKLVSYWLIYIGTVRTTLTEPFRMLAHGASTFDAVPDPTVVVDEGGIIRQANRAARLFLGRPDADVVGRHCHDLFHDRRVALADCPVCGHIAAGRPLGEAEVEVSAVGHWHQISLSPISSGTVTSGMVHVSRDVTRRKDAETALRESEARFRGLVENLHDWIWEVDENGLYTYCSPQAAALLGYRPEDLLGRSPFDLMPPREAAAVREQFEAHVRARRPFKGLENINLHKDGGEVVMETSAVPFVDAGGRFRGYRGIDRDITDRKRAECALRRSEKTYRTLVDNLTQCVFLKDRDSVYRSCNRSYAELLGIEPAAIAGRSMYELHPHELADRYRADDLRILATGRTEELVEPYRTRDGEITIHTVKSPVQDDDGNVIGILGIFWDITEQRRIDAELARYRNHLEQRVEERTRELQASNRDLESFSYSVSHDLRAPLRSLDGFSRLLQENYAAGLDDTGRHYLERVVAAGRRMAQLIDALLQLSRIARTELRRCPVDLREIARGVVDELRAAEPEREVRFVCPDPLPVEGDPELLRVVLDNLIGNAWKFTARSDAATIEVGAGAIDGREAYFVRDNGAGFDMRYAAKLFAPFQRLHKEADYPGTGIGLATVARIIRAHHGEIVAEGALGQGATFRFSLGGGAAAAAETPCAD